MAQRSKRRVTYLPARYQIPVRVFAKPWQNPDTGSARVAARRRQCEVTAGGLRRGGRSGIKRWGGGEVIVEGPGRDLRKWAGPNCQEKIILPAVSHLRQGRRILAEEREKVRAYLRECRWVRRSSSRHAVESRGARSLPPCRMPSQGVVKVTKKVPGLVALGTGQGFGCDLRQGPAKPSNGGGVEERMPEQAPASPVSSFGFGSGPVWQQRCAETA